MPYLKLNDSGEYFLNENHNYYYQIQDQLMCTVAKNDTLVIRAGTDLKVNNITYIDIYGSDTFICNISFAKLKHFFDNHFKSVLLGKLYYK